MSFFSNVNRYKTRLLPLAIVLFLGIVVLLTLILNQNKQDLRSKAETANDGELTFTNPTPATVAPNDTFTIAVNMATLTQTVVGADVLVTFDQCKLKLQNIVKGTGAGSNIYKTFAPVDASGNFDVAKVKTNANTSAGTCSGNVVTGIVEFGVVSFDWAANSLTSPTPGSVMTPVATLTFLVKSGASGTTELGFKNDGLNVTTDANIVVIPPGSENPEDILKAPGYNNSSATVTISSTASPAPSATPEASASPSPTPSGSPTSCNACYNFNSTGNIDIQDVQYVGNRYGAKTGETNYNSIYDVYCGADTPNANPDGIINILDVQMVGNRYFQSSCSPL